MSVEANKQASREGHEAFGTTNLKSAYDKFLAKEFRALFFGHGWVDRDAYMKGDLEFVAAFEKITMLVEDVIGEGDLVFCRMRWRGRQAALVLGVEPSGRDFDVIGFCQDRCQSGKVVEHIPLFDVASLMQQLKGRSSNAPA
ncbi:MAG: ester cyclase [Gemmatimonadaceae bacterium]